MADSQTEVARTLRGAPQAWVSKLMARLRGRGRGCLRASVPAPARPHRTRRRRRPVELILLLRKQLAEAGLDAGAETIGWHLSATTRSHAVPGDDQPDPDPRRRGHPATGRNDRSPPTSGSKPIDAQRDLAVRLTHYRLADPTAPGRRRDHQLARRLRPLRPVESRRTRRVTGPIVLDTFRQTADQHGIPASTLTDNGMVYTVRLGRRPRRPERTSNTELRRLKHGPEELPPQPPHHLRQGGTVPADHEEVAARPDRSNRPRSPNCRPARRVRRRATTTDRPHRSLPHRATPADRSTTARPKAIPDSDRTPTPTTGSATTRSARPATSPCAWPADYATSESAEPTPEPASSCSSKTWTSESSTPPPANSSASSPSTPDETTSPPDTPATPKRRRRTTIVGPDYRGCPETSHGARGSVLVQDIGGRCLKT